MGGEGWAAQALAAAEPAVFWTDRPDAPPAGAALAETIEVDLAVVGGGYTGLWAALQALEDQPGRRVVVLEADHCGFGASSRNGGFCDSSLTHGLANGLSHWPDEIETLVRLGRQNLADLAATLDRYGIDADYWPVPEVGVATEPWHLEDLAEEIDHHRAVGDDVDLLDADQMQTLVRSPTYLGGLIRRNDVALVDPAALGWGLRAAAQSLGAEVYDSTPATALRGHRRGIEINTPGGRVRAAQAVVATNAYPGPLKRPRRYTIPVYDHVLVTEPLSAEQRQSIGWGGREGMGDVSNQFHYYRLTADGRILWGGYDATYHFNNGVAARHDQSPPVHAKLADHFFATFPQLEGLSFSHRWGGPIGTTTRFTAAWGTAHRGRLVWVGGYTGLGVGASRFGARVALDLLHGAPTERTELAMVRTKPVPFPPEPARWAGVQLTRRALQRADARQGRRGPWLRLLDRFGVGFDS
ncbi:NAD(P)/FAD-dependent oxidoreductase [Candidatus Poriferisocius sp.]|uniref:NAD(P)/FAD-dependent oxidoreductase n=1 Tax=Candidatus Poriferisocius sp. TaxID=3101276 RepID=UPI003B5BD493